MSTAPWFHACRTAARRELAAAAAHRIYHASWNVTGRVVIESVTHSRI
jgi:hypothetical protein